MGRYFTTGELSRSNTADLHGIPNHPNTYQKMNLNKLIDNVLDPIRAKWGKPIYVTSGFRSGKLNELIGGSKTSFHMRGLAADITTGNPKDNRKLFDLIVKMVQNGEIEIDQMISEKPIGGNPSWIHIGYNEDNNRGQIFTIQ